MSQYLKEWLFDQLVLQQVTPRLADGCERLHGTNWAGLLQQIPITHLIVYHSRTLIPNYCRLLREAGQCGAKVVTRVEMFIGQAYEQYERFTGLP
ncbi:hypothetical protein OSB04_030089 [Centaurea solstitialis]|uniref:Uncharacterized protein n=1 Tax=Centaurea solstitialis TaxID=347529 RepID=A0AA38SJ64_9ASTR|nr:hypothetical protein OSB04_030089 [Centaurea solstitialis]